MFDLSRLNAYYLPVRIVCMLSKAFKQVVYMYIYESSPPVRSYSNKSSASQPQGPSTTLEQLVLFWRCTFPTMLAAPADAAINEGEPHITVIDAAVA